MAAEIIEQPSLGYLFKAVSNLVKLPTSTAKMWLDYDAEVDILYLHFVPAPASTHSEMTDEFFILVIKDEELVGLTILDASQR